MLDINKKSKLSNKGWSWEEKAPVMQKSTEGGLTGELPSKWQQHSHTWTIWGNNLWLLDIYTHAHMSMVSIGNSMDVIP